MSALLTYPRRDGPPTRCVCAGCPCPPELPSDACAQHRREFAAEGIPVGDHPIAGEAPDETARRVATARYMGKP